METRSPAIAPVILAGGTGTRLWPLSRKATPKQFLPLITERAMLQDTLARVGDRTRFAPPILVCSEAHGALAQAQLTEMGLSDADVILEPVGRNSAPAIAVAALHILARDPEGLLFAMPADHLISPLSRFHEIVDQAAAVARSGRLVTYGIQPTRPETGYGYIRAAAALDGTGAFDVAAFVEKPDYATAKRYVASGQYYWNSGMFLFRARDYIDELTRFAPKMMRAARAAYENAYVNGVARTLDRAAMETCPDDSIDYAVMEHTERGAVVPADFDWSDIGSWDVLADHMEPDTEGVIALGDVEAEGCENVYIRSEGPFVGAVGLKNIVVVATGDAILIADRGKCQDVKKIVAALGDRLR